MQLSNNFQKILIMSRRSKYLCFTIKSAILSPHTSKVHILVLCYFNQLFITMYIYYRILPWFFSSLCSSFCFVLIIITFFSDFRLLTLSVRLHGKLFKILSNVYYNEWGKRKQNNFDFQFQILVCGKIYKRNKVINQTNLTRI